MTLDRKEHWETVYRTKGHDSVSWYETAPQTSLELVEACGLDSDMGIIDIGGGTSGLVDGLLEQGYSNICVLDIASEALQATRARLGSRADLVRWVVADVTLWESQSTFHLWHDRAVFHFLRSPAEQDRYRRALERSLEPGGWAVLATFGPDGPPRCSGLDVARCSDRDIAAALGDEFELKRAFTQVHTTPAGIEQQFQWAVLRRLGGA
jgi:trans-aconitate methyltransferase